MSRFGFFLAGLSALGIVACSDSLGVDDTLGPQAIEAVASLVVKVPDSAGSPLIGTPFALGASAPVAGIVLPERALVIVEIKERNAAWWHALSIVSPENRLLAGPGVLSPGLLPELGPYDAVPVTFSLEAFNPREPHQSFGIAQAQITGSFPSWTIGFEDSTDNDFNDIIVRVTAQVVDCEMFDEEVSDPLLLDPAVQEILMELAELSNFDQPFANRLERGGYIVEQPDGSIEFLEHRYLTPEGTLGGQPELCMLPWDPGYQKDITDGGGTILGQIHTHPKHRGTEPNPGTCNQWIPKPDGTFDVQPRPGPRLRFTAGPSLVDLEDWESAAAPWPGYLMSPDRIYRWERKGRFQRGLTNRDDFKLKKGDDACIAQ